MSEYKEIVVNKTPRWVKILIAILILGNIVGWSAYSDQITKHRQSIEDLKREISQLKGQIENLEYERDSLFYDVKKLSQQPFDVSGISEASRSHTIEDIFDKPEFWNTGQDIDDFYNRVFLETGRATWLFEIFTGEWNIGQFARHIWDVLSSRGIKSVIVVGNYDVNKTKFSESNHAWLLIFYQDKSTLEKTIFVVEPLERKIISIPVKNNLPLTFDEERKIDYWSGYGVTSLWIMDEKYLQGYAYTSSLDLEAELERR